MAIELEADRMRNLRLREDDRRPEMTVVRNEYERGENDPAEALEKEMWAVAFLAHPYHHSTIGWRSDFEKVPIEKLRKFYDTFYWPNNATVTIIGDFDPATALELVKQYYGTIPSSPQPIPEVYTEEPPQTGPRRVTVQRPGELGVVMIAQENSAGHAYRLCRAARAGQILSDGRNSRFYQALTDKKLTTGVDAAPQFNRDPSLFFVSAELTPDATHADVEKRLLEEIGRVQNDGVSADEVAAAIAKLTADTAYERDGSMAKADDLNECIAVGDWRLYYGLEDAVKEVTAADVQRVAKKYFTEDQRSTGWYIPRNEEAAEAADTADKSTASSDSGTSDQRFGKGGGEQPKPPVALARRNQAAAAAPAVAKIAPRIVRSHAADVDLLVCPTEVKDVVTIKGVLPAFDPANPILGELAADMLERGTTKHDAEAIATLLDQVGAQIGFSYEAGNVIFAARCLKKDSALVIGLLAEQLGKPSFADDEFEKLRKQKLAESQQLKEDTDSQALIAFRRAVFPVGHPQYRLTPDERIAALQKVSVADVKAFHANYFGPKYCTLVAVGDVAAAKIQAEVASAFADWKGGRPLPEAPAPIAITESKELTINVPGKESVSVILGAERPAVCRPGSSAPGGRNERTGARIYEPAAEHGARHRGLDLRDRRRAHRQRPARAGMDGRRDVCAIAVEARAGFHATRVGEVASRRHHGGRARLSEERADRCASRESGDEQWPRRNDSEHRATGTRTELD